MKSIYNKFNAQTPKGMGKSANDKKQTPKPFEKVSFNKRGK
jgi:hypothetical protein